MSSQKVPYIVCIEGKEYEWHKPEISYEEIVELGGWEAANGVIEIDKHQNERPLQPGEIVEVKPGQGFSKKICWKRGLDDIYQARLDEELALLQSVFSQMEFVEDGRWVLMPDYLRGSGWTPETGPIVFQIPEAPTAPPYAFFVPAGIRFNGAIPTNYQENGKAVVPFEGNWGVFSWAPNDGAWRPGATVRSGSNMLNWALGFTARFKQGA